MALFNLFGTEKRESIREGGITFDTGATDLYDMLVERSKAFSGEAVNRTTALGVPAVAAAVNAISDAIAQLPLQLFKNTPEGRVKADRDPLYRVVHDVVNADLLTSYQWRKWLVTELMLEGRALTFIERNKAGRVMGLWPMALASVTIDIKNGRRRYVRQRTDGQPADVYGAAEVLDFVWMPAADGIGHINPIKNARNAIGLAIAAERYASVMFENGGVPPLVLTGVDMAPKAADRASFDLEQTMKFVRQNRKIATPLPTGMDLKPLGIDPDKQQMLEVRKFQIIEMARVFNIPPVLLHDLTGGTFNNSAQQAAAFVKFCLGSRLALIEAEMNTKLFPATQFGFVEFNVDGLLRGDDTARSNFYGTAFKNAWMTPNEIRALENRPRSDQPEADLLHVQGATVPLGMQSTALPAAEDPTQTQTEEPGEPAAPAQ